MVIKEHSRKKVVNKRKGKSDNLNDNGKGQLRKYEEKGQKLMHDNLGNEKKTFNPLSVIVALI